MGLTPILVSDAQLYAVWGVALAVATASALALAVLLVVILSVSRSIEGHVARSLAAVRRISQDLTALESLADTNRLAGNILAVTRAIERQDNEIADTLSG